MKKLIALFLALMLGASMVACGSDGGEDPESTGGISEPSDTESTEKEEEEKIVDGDIIEYCPDAVEYLGENYEVTMEDGNRVVHRNFGMKHTIQLGNGMEKTQYEYKVTYTLHPEKDVIISKRIEGDYKKDYKGVAFNFVDFLDTFPFTLSYKNIISRIENERVEENKNGEKCYEYSCYEDGVTYTYFENKTTQEVFIEVAVDRSYNLEPHLTEQSTEYDHVIKLKNYKVKAYYPYRSVITIVSVCDRCGTEYDEYTFRPEYYSENETLNSMRRCDVCSKNAFDSYYFDLYRKVFN